MPSVETTQNPQLKVTCFVRSVAAKRRVSLYDLGTQCKLIVEFPKEYKENRMRYFLVPDAPTEVELVINRSANQVLFDLGNWAGGAMVQNAFPYLSTDERELLLTGGVDI